METTRLTNRTAPAEPLRVAMLSYHTCPLAMLGGKKTGGMNVYVRDLSRALAKKGITVDVFTRSQDDCAPRVVHDLGPGARVMHIPAGPERPIPVSETERYLDEFVAKVNADMVGNVVNLASRTARFAARQKRLLGDALVLARDSRQAAQELIRLLEDPEERQRRGQEGKNRMGPAGATAQLVAWLERELGWCTTCPPVALYW